MATPERPPHLDVIQPPGWPRPRGYANGIAARGRTLFVAGQVGWDAAGRLVSEDLAPQFVQALDNVLAVVRAAGGSPADVARLTVYVTSVREYADAHSFLKGAWRDRFGRHYPAMTLVGVAELFEAGAKVEIEGVAVLPE